MLHSAKENFDVAHSLSPAARTASTNGTGVDLSGFNQATVLIVAGAWTDGSHAFAVQESDDNSSFSAVAAGDLDGSNPTISSAGGQNQTYRIGYKGAKRYLRVATTCSGTTTGAVYGAVVLRQQPRKLPK